MAGLGFELQQSSSRTPTLDCYAVLSAHLSPPLPFSLCYPSSDGSSTTPCVAKGQSESLLTNPGATRPHLPGPAVQNLPYSAPVCRRAIRTSFYVVDLVLFCFSLHCVPWETLKGYILPPRDTEGTGPERAPGISQTPASAWLGVRETWHYLFIYRVLLSSTPPKLLLPTGEDEKRLQTMGDKVCHMAPSV